MMPGRTSYVVGVQQLAGLPSPFWSGYQEGVLVSRNMPYWQVPGVSLSAIGQLVPPSLTLPLRMQHSFGADPEPRSEIERPVTRQLSAGPRVVNAWRNRDVTVEMIRARDGPSIVVDVCSPDVRRCSMVKEGSAR